MLGGPETGGGSGGVDPDSTNLIAFDPGDIGLPDGGSVTLTISGDVDYDETAGVSEDGMVYFLIPAMRVGSEITVKITVRDDTDKIVKSGSKKQTVTDGCSIAVTLNSGVPEDFVLVDEGNFYICDHELTQGEYETYCSYGGSSPSATYGAGPDYPAYYVNWYDTLVYCNKRSIAEGLTPVYSIGGSTNPSDWGSVPTPDNATWNAVSVNASADGYRLPTEAEWLLAADDGHTYSGSDDIDEVAWYRTNSGGKTHEVKGKAANARDIYDMSGNVWEWCFDKSGSSRVNRGGCWDSSAGYCPVSFRNSYGPASRGYLVGFRLVRSAP
ncbi:MAG: formylglycine-generating enzyme family protein [Treponema sp.]|nr:formylglycine-generating enzyme family protein [Treponema sp.]